MKLPPLGPNRRAIRRPKSDKYLLITVLSFAASVGLTRAFLYLTGFPQLGGGELHIAHVLWGGLFLFAASLLPLILANRWALTWSALLSGIGVGLFIDEVGKFITATNDYFTPAAAPIVYAFFLLTLLVYLRNRRPRRSDSRAALYDVLDQMEEVVDHDLSEDELKQMLARLKEAEQRAPGPEIQKLAVHLADYLRETSASAEAESDTLLERWQKVWHAWEERWLPRGRFRWLLTAALAAYAAWPIFSTTGVLLVTRNPEQLQELVQSLVDNRLLRNESGLNWFEARIGMEGSVGFALALTALLFALGLEKKGVNYSAVILILSITVFTPLLFYFDQFSAIFNTIVQFLLLVFIYRYRQRFMEDKSQGGR